MSDLQIRRLKDGSFLYVSGPEKDFEELTKVHKYYHLHTTKQGIAVEDCERLCKLIQDVALGAEQGYQDYDSLKCKAAELKAFMESRGHKLTLAYLTD